MELTVALVISILGAVMTVANFVIGRKDKTAKEVKEHQKEFSKHDLIEYRLDELTKKVDKILEKLDTYDKEVEDRINRAIESHIKQYHK